MFKDLARKLQVYAGRLQGLQGTESQLKRRYGKEILD